MPPHRLELDRRRDGAWRRGATDPAGGAPPPDAETYAFELLEAGELDRRARSRRTPSAAAAPAVSLARIGARESEIVVACPCGCRTIVRVEHGEGP
jgi:hypothetical protein